MEIPNDNQALLSLIDLVLVEGGTFQMGDDSSGIDREGPAHQVSLNSFYIGKYQVTQELWEAVMENNPSFFKGAKRPVESVSWNDIKGFLEKINKSTSRAFRLPSESEWEYAARGGKYSQGYTYSGSDKLKQVGWYEENSNNETHEVGLLLANELGLYDMSGNVLEWCEDDYHTSYKDAPVDGKAWVDSPKRGDSRVLRGGGYFNGPVGCRLANRDRHSPGNRDRYVGFRLALSLQSAL